MDELKPQEAAIAYFEDAIKESDEIIDECTLALQEELTEQKQHFVVALDALRRAAPENKPLVLEQLRKMQGQPVYCIGQTRFDVHFDGWKVVTKNNSMVNVIRFTDGTDFPVEVYGKRLLAYARKPEGSEKEI